VVIPISHYSLIELVNAMTRTQKQNFVHHSLCNLFHQAGPSASNYMVVNQIM